jgi:GAF domain-containing protein
MAGGSGVEDYEDGIEQPIAPPAAEALEAAVRPALTVAARLFLVAGVALVVVDERGGLGWAAAAGDLGEVLEGAIGPLWSGPCQEVLLGGSLVRTSDLPDDPRWPDLAAALGFAGVNSLLCVPVGGPAGPSATLTVVRRPDRPWQTHEVESVMAYGGVLADLLRLAGESETRAQVIAQLEHALRHRVTIEQAKGILMEREGLDPAAAFDRLRTAARAARRRVGEVAAEVVDGQPLPEPDNDAS